ncbi:MAG: nucleotidyltransferase family protein [Blastocatellia bacterium]
MIIKEAIRQKGEEIRRIAAEHGAINVRVFGSVARGEDRPDSDLDLLIDVGPKTSSWFPVGLILDLEKLLDCQVEVVTEKSLNPLFREQVLREAIQI